MRHNKKYFIGGHFSPPGTVDCILKPFRASLRRKQNTGTKPGRLLKDIIPVKPLDFNIGCVMGHSPRTVFQFELVTSRAPLRHVR